MSSTARLILVATVMVAVLATAAFAAGTAEDSGQAIHVNGEGYAADGADVVAYFSLQPGDDPVGGSQEHAHEWRGATWLFSSAENLAAFRQNPERYAPAYGGYCAYAMARDRIAPIDPERWDIVDGRLYLNYNERTQRQWRDNVAQDIERADQAWPAQAARLSAE